MKNTKYNYNCIWTRLQDGTIKAWFDEFSYLHIEVNDLRDISKKSAEALGRELVEYEDSIYLEVPEAISREKIIDKYYPYCCTMPIYCDTERHRFMSCPEAKKLREDLRNKIKIVNGWDDLDKEIYNRQIEEIAFLIWQTKIKNERNLLL